MNNYDVIIIGGGPGGSTTGTLLKKYQPDLNVLVLEREVFPRDHVGESQLPAISPILDEMGVWDEVEAANFPIKIGATYRWGTTRDLWDFDFVPVQSFKDEARPAKFEGQRLETAFQVDRAIYDEILLNHAANLGCEVRQGTRVTKVLRDEDKVIGLELGDGSVVSGRYYIDASGSAAVLRRALGIKIEQPTLLQNIAIWDYWQNAKWAEEIGVGATRIQIMSLGYGWIWFIPLGPERTSIGLVVPATYYKESGKRPEDLYHEAIASDERLSELIESGQSEGKLSSTKDWSYVSERWVGDNWMLVGESGGFADPILSAGMTLTHTSAREAAYTILELDRKELDGEWLKARYERYQSQRVRQHMRFAEFWYTANTHFTDLKLHCAEIAKESGIVLDADGGWRWLGTGGFAFDTYGEAGIGGFSVASIKQMLQRFTSTQATWKIGQNNVFKMNVSGARRSKYAIFVDGHIVLEDAIARGDLELPLTGLFGVVISVLHRHSDITEIADGFLRHFRAEPWLDDINLSVQHAFHTLETMVVNGWVDASVNPNRPRLKFYTPDDSACLHDHGLVVGVPVGVA